MDDPLMWGFLPLRYNFGLQNWTKRWGFGSHDICYQTRPLALFFTMGQVLPTHRLAHSPYGGIAQPAVTQAIRLLSKGPFPVEPHPARPERQHWSIQNVCVDPFSDLPTAYTTDGHDSHLAPSAYACNSYSWFHIFPEGKIHQAPHKTMRYFKWGVARLILEATECPDVVPIWLEGFDQIMHESREFPRFLPRPGKEVSVTFGEKVDIEAIFGESRKRWQELKAKAELAAPETRDQPVGVLSDELLYGREAVELRKEVTKKVRDLVLDVRRSRGLTDEDPKEGLVETWIQEGPKREGKMQDDSWHHNHSFAKPASSAHHTLASSGPRGSHNDRFRPSQASSGAESSVNDLISHLRRTQVTRPAGEDGPRTRFGHIASRSVHPSLRSVLELPEPPPPRPRPGTRRAGVGGRPLRRLAGPPPPESWILGNSAGDNDEEDEMATSESSQTERIIYRLDRLPGTTIPEKGTLLHTVLKSMASHWAWHIQYDGQFLDTLPSHIKMLLLSYVGIYARDQSIAGIVHGLRPLFEKEPLDNRDEEDEMDRLRQESEVVRLDLSCAIGRWISIHRLSHELVVSRRSGPEQHKKEPVPSSWDAESDEDSGEFTRDDRGATLPPAPSLGLRFQNLRYLSLAHPTPAAANWNSLINLLSRLSTLTHLSLAHWPLPTVTPNAIAPTSRVWSLSYSTPRGATFQLDNDWAEAAGILRRLARATYCLKWLDLEGCGEWLGALSCDSVGPNGETHTAGPEWNGSWRNIEQVRIGPGWLPPIDDSELLPASGLAGYSSSRSLATSIHSPIRDGSEDTDLPWDVELERIKYRRSKEMEQFRETLQTAKEVQQRVHRVRREGKGKWVQFSYGLEGLDESVLKKLIGAVFVQFLP
ncbi:hypothetical protein P170DRAFT_443584 [Aspergillus steynii IBT 23096]|uniref:Uncharacterized protein n=1 Tax=Aspergillus steynii IBT 23096 TaxID=1392250 RepID=A0A2I2GSN5_9EURO|nr:uncharacterized protein P170DRAFT_443584 [Aspergillus steynii IBT 23096]PLB55892.1 hypothetical protein P170DRAFT_443584 [Aspergillus steynii IBT 23096]